MKPAATSSLRDLYGGICNERTKADLVIAVDQQKSPPCDGVIYVWGFVGRWIAITQSPPSLFTIDFAVLPLKNLFLLANGKINGPGKGQAKNI